MSNVLEVSLQTTIYSLAQRGWSQRRIAKELGINRETVGRYLRLPKPAISTAGFEDGATAKRRFVRIAKRSCAVWKTVYELLTACRCY